jgi:acyl-ACP thioesterase
MTVDEATLPPTPPDATFMRSVVRPHELDPMDHVNNGVYLDHFEDAVGGITGGPEALARLPRRIQLEYLVPAGPGDELEAAVWRAGVDVLHRLRSGAGVELLRGRLTGVTR